MIKLDPFYFLSAIELALVLSVLSLFLFFRNRKYKDLYEKTLRKLNDLQSKENTETYISQHRAAEAPPVNLPEEPPIDITKDIFDRQLTDSVFTESPDTDETSSDQLSRLQRMVNFQKKAILELMCYKDIFESARSRLNSLSQSNYDLQERIRGLLEGGMDGVGVGEAITALETNNHELEKFITILDRENTTLSGKFHIWEEKFKRIAEDAKESSDNQVPDDVKYSQVADDVRHTEVTQEKEELLSRIKEFEEKIEEKDKSLESMQAQYEDLEKEYMILYRQQQAQEQKQP